MLANVCEIMGGGERLLLARTVNNGAISHLSLVFSELCSVVLFLSARLKQMIRTCVFMPFQCYFSNPEVFFPLSLSLALFDF